MHQFCMHGTDIPWESPSLRKSKSAIIWIGQFLAQASNGLSECRPQPLSHSLGQYRGFFSSRLRAKIWASKA